MNDIKPSAGLRYYILAVFAFVLVSFTVQALSHFVINVEHYASIPYMREQPVMVLGIITMLLQGVILAHLYLYFCSSAPSVSQGLQYGLLMGLFLGSYIALVQPAKFAVPSIVEWIAVEGIASAAQFALYGLLLGWVHAKTNAKN